jgi:hypothetical protein
MSAMEFEERIRQVIADGLQQMEEEKRLDAEFTRGWAEVRSTVWSVLSRAKKAADGTPYGALRPDQTNGCTVLDLYENGSRGAHVACQLKFCPDEDTRQIVCSVKPESLIPEGDGFPESFSLDALTETVVEDKAEAFFKALLRRTAEKQRPGRRRRSVYP